MNWGFSQKVAARKRERRAFYVITYVVRFYSVLCPVALTVSDFGSVLLK